MGYGGLLQEEIGEDDPKRLSLNQILAASERAANLTKNLLAFSRKQVIAPKIVDINEIIKGVEKLLRRLIGEDIEIRTILNPSIEGISVMADKGQIEQVLMNLATNARDAMPDGGLLNIETGFADITEEYAKRYIDVKTGKYALISISDTGTGMNENTRSRIFEPFFTTKEMGRGTGLGLSIVYGIIKQHNGFINVYSEIGKGTTFKIYLPLIKKGIEEEESKVLPPPKGGTETLLLAEDDKDARGLTKTVLELHGYKVLEAVDGEDAVRVFNENKEKIKMIILDVIMPKKDGRAAYEEIKKIVPEIKSLFLSGYTADIINKRGILDTELNFVSKPVSPPDLLRKIREILDR
jgi:CheY-like chemotaxis protein